MNITLQMNPVHIAQTRTAAKYPRVFALLIQVFNQIFSYRDDPAAVHYAGAKYGDGWD
jgi:hypothetical protein